jgi:hypothetical protein
MFLDPNIDNFNILYNTLINNSDIGAVACES